MKSLSIARAVGAIALVVASVLLVAPSADAGTSTEPRVVLLYDSNYVDTTPGGSGEAYNVRQTLTDLGIAPVLVTDLSTADFTALLQGTDDFVIPEVDGAELVGAMTTAQLDAVIAYVEAGGRIQMFGSHDPFPFINAVTGSTLSRNDDEVANCTASDFQQGVDKTCQRSAAAATTEFAGGPSALGYNNDTYGAPISVDANTKVIYTDAGPNTGAAAVLVQPAGHGSVVYFAWDWYFDTGAESGPIDQGWFQVLADSLAVGVSIDDVTVTEGQTATFTISLSSAASQDVVVDYATADGTAVDGQDYTGQSGTVVVPAGETSVTVDVPTLERPGEQGTRTFVVDIQTPLWGVAVDAEGVGTIIDAPTTTTTATPLAVVTPRFTG